MSFLFTSKQKLWKKSQINENIFYFRFSQLYRIYMIAVGGGETYFILYISCTFWLTQHRMNIIFFSLFFSLRTRIFIYRFFFGQLILSKKKEKKNIVGLRISTNIVHWLLCLFCFVMSFYLKFLYWKCIEKIINWPAWQCVVYSFLLFGFSFPMFFSFQNFFNLKQFFLLSKDETYYKNKQKNYNIHIL